MTAPYTMTPEPARLNDRALWQAWRAARDAADDPNSTDETIDHMFDVEEEIEALPVKTVGLTPLRVAIVVQTAFFAICDRYGHSQDGSDWPQIMRWADRLLLDHLKGAGQSPAWPMVDRLTPGNGRSSAGRHS